MQSKSPSLASIVPFVLFMAWLCGWQFLAPWLTWDHPSAPWWKQMPELWGYAIQVLLCGGALIYFRKGIKWDWQWKSQIIGILAGVLGIALWILPSVLYDNFASLGYEAANWWSWVGLEPRDEGFSPSKVFEPGSVSWIVAYGIRFLRAVVIVAFCEELFWRNYLMRVVENTENPWKVPFGKATWKTWLIPTLAFVFIHGQVDWVAAFIYGTICWGVAVITKNLTATITMHATANLLMGIAAIAWNKPGFW